uniref:Uncharacterized protein n=1 Tax=Anguilla anguilla TaxID=7936 RepID=A0A0E9WLZ1_ANGAN
MLYAVFCNVIYCKPQHFFVADYAFSEENTDLLIESLHDGECIHYAGNYHILPIMCLLCRRKYFSDTEK